MGLNFPIFPLADHTEATIAKGDVEQAAADHNASVDHAFKQGGLINLTDLFASQAAVIKARWRARQRAQDIKSGTVPGRGQAVSRGERR